MLIAEKENLSIDEAEHDAFIQKIIEVNGAYLPDADSVYKSEGIGNIEAGEAYMKNKTAVKDFIIANYDK